MDPALFALPAQAATPTNAIATLISPLSLLRTADDKLRAKVNSGATSPLETVVTRIADNCPDQKTGIEQMNNRYLYASMLAAALLWAAPVAAADTEAMSSEALILKPLVLTKLSDLSFGSIIRSGSGDLVTINADTGARTSASAILVPSDPGYRASFASSGLNSAAVFLVVSPPGDLLNGAGNTLTVTNLSLDQGGNPSRLLTPTSQVFFVGIGGQVFVRSNQEDGIYTGTFSLTAYYF